MRTSVVRIIANPNRGMLCLAVLLGLGGGLRAEEAPNADLIEMIVNLVSDKDRDTRSLGLQQVRDEAKGPAATKQFAALLPKLPPDSQAGLLDALGGRGDRTARLAILPMVKSEDVAVRVAALRALGPLGEAADVPLLTRQLTAAGPEKTAAREALVRLSGPEVRAAIVAEVKRATPEVRAELLGVLGARKEREALPVVLQYAGDKDAAVRLAAVTALRGLAGQDQAATLVLVLKAAKDDQEQWQAEQALLAVCGRDRETWVPAILEGMAGAGPSARAVLLRVLARSHGAKVLAAIVSAARDPQPEVSKEALRLLANWPDAAAVPPLRAIAREAKSLRENVVAVQGLIHMASPVKDKPADVDLLVEAMKLARRSQEKQMASSILQAAADSKDPQIRQRAQKALQTLGRP
jgi:HEAT repeat protein